MRSLEIDTPCRVALLLLASLQFAGAQPAPSDEEAAKKAALAKAALNPVASLISVPFQNSSTLLTL